MHPLFFLLHPCAGDSFFYLTRPLLLGEAPPPLLTPPLLRREDLKPGRPGLYSQTSSRPVGVARECLRNRVASVCAPRARLHKGGVIDDCLLIIDYSHIYNLSAVFIKLKQVFDW